MPTLETTSFDALDAFPDSDDTLAIVARHAPADSGPFFSLLMKHSFQAIGKISAHSAKTEITQLLERFLPDMVRAHAFYGHWLDDMANVSRLFAKLMRSDAISFCLGTDRGCPRYHVDNVPLRLLVTYAGIGTEWLPENAADRKAWAEGAANEDILIDPGAKRFINAWDVALFRGGEGGVLHRSPDATKTEPSVLLRLDHGSFWDMVHRPTFAA